MRILVLGGTKFVGRGPRRGGPRARATSVTLFHRGRTNPGLFPEAEHVLGDRDGGLGALAGREWDACIDVSGLPAAARRRRGRRPARPVGRYVYVSTISVYADLSVPRDEGGPLATIEDETTEEIDGDTYGALKALGEQRVTWGRSGTGRRSCGPGT